MQLKFRLLLLALFIFPLTLCAGEVTPDACTEKTDEKFVAMLEEVKKLDLDYFDRERNLIKHWETLYNPLWQARVKKDDPFSTSRHAEGEMLYKRYNQMQEDYLALAEEASAGMAERLEAVRESVKSLPGCCNSTAYRMCMNSWRDDLNTRVDAMEQFLKNRKTHEIEFSSRLRAALEEKPSDHDAFEDRYAEQLTKWAASSRAGFLSKIRDIREKLEVDWPGPKCCAQCTEEGQDESNDPVLKRVKPDPQGNKGVAGNIVNNSDIKAAFDRYDMEKKKKR